jgi:hypothetical protein
MFELGEGESIFSHSNDRYNDNMRGTFHAAVPLSLCHSQLSPTGQGQALQGL